MQANTKSKGFMFKWLLVGDMHAVLDELKACLAIIDACISICRERKLDTVVFLGDQHDSHAILNLEVINFWYESFQKLKKAGLRVIVIPGNHDYPGDIKSTFSSMSIYKHDCVVVEKLSEIDGVTFVPYYFDHEKFVEDLKDVENTIICHQTFDGSRYDNGFYAKGGIDQKRLRSKTIISGHIHTPSIIGNVEYIGAPRWRNANDCDSIRHLCIFDTKTLEREYIPTDKYVAPIKRIHVDESNFEEAQKQILSSSYVNYVATVTGDSVFCQQASKALSGKCKIKTVVKKERQTTLKESEGMSVSVKKHLESYQTKRCDKATFMEYAQKAMSGL